MKALTALTAGTPARNSKIVASDYGGRNMTLSAMLQQILLADLPSGDALPNQVLIWNGEAWVPADVLAMLTAALPTSPPGTSGALWNNGGVVCITP